MSDIALKHGGTIDKFIGDAILIFFGDPETKGDAEDAKACLRMAIEMQHRLAELNAKWRNAGLEHTFGVRIGINTGFCNVGNFGSADRMDYTIIGAEANLAARLQSIAEPGHIVASYETYALVRDTVAAHALPPITMKGISREVIPYGRRHARRGGPEDQNLQRAFDWAGFLPRSQHGPLRLGGANLRRVAGRDRDPGNISPTADIANADPGVDIA
jgi:adenylate cyclase